MKPTSTSSVKMQRILAAVYRQTPRVLQLHVQTLGPDLHRHEIGLQPIAYLLRTTERKNRTFEISPTPVFKTGHPP